jgi:mono/diheme cytochrome c family protein
MPRLDGLLRLGAACVLAASWSVPAAAEEPIEEGKRLYLDSCAACHGMYGEGDGPVAAALVVAPPDLTTLARNCDGRFPADTVRAYMDGREEIAAHGNRMMPVWGSEFWLQAGADGGAERIVKEKIDALTAFLESIQEP